jgi:hypothetical protein
MTTRVQRIAGKLSELNLQIRHSMEQAEAKVNELNRLIAQLADSDLLGEEVFLGKAREVPQGLDIDESDSGRVIQAVLLVPEGFGVCQWSSEKDFAHDRGSATFPKKARRRFCAFHQLTSADKAFLLPYIEMLLDELMDIADVAASKLKPGRPVEAAAFIRSLQKAKGTKPLE